MSDQKLRELERRWRETGSVEDEAAYLRERVRVGDLTQERLKLAAVLGHCSAALACPVQVPMLPDPQYYGAPAFARVSHRITAVASIDPVLGLDLLAQGVLKQLEREGEPNDYLYQAIQRMANAAVEHARLGRDDSARDLEGRMQDARCQIRLPRVLAAAVKLGELAFTYSALKSWNERLDHQARAILRFLESSGLAAGAIEEECRLRSAYPLDAHHPRC